MPFLGARKAKTGKNSKRLCRIQKVFSDLRAKLIEMNEKWAEELSRNFLPRFVCNSSSEVVHSVKNAYATGCGRDSKSSQDFQFKSEIPKLDPSNWRVCDAVGCVKLFERCAQDS